MIFIGHSFFAFVEDDLTISVRKLADCFIKDLPVEQQILIEPVIVGSVYHFIKTISKPPK